MAYATSSDVKAWVTITDSALDALVAESLAAAVEWVDGRVHRKGGTGGVFLLDGSASARYFDVTSDGVVYTDDIGDPSITVATDSALDGTYATSWLASDFQLLPLSTSEAYWKLAAVGTQSFTWPTRRTGLVKVTAKWGWPTVPASVKQATIMKAAQILSRRNSPNGVAGFNDFGIVRVQATDAQIDELLERYTLITVG